MRIFGSRLGCTGEVILSAGALASPTILQRSGIGDARELAELGIAVKAHSPAVGRALAPPGAAQRCSIRVCASVVSVDMALTFKRRFPTFDYGASRTAAPQMASFQEVLTFGLNLPYNHQQQSLNLEGSLTLKRIGKSLQIAGLGYRDHSWVMRADHIVSEHSWCAFNFPDRAFGIKKITTLHRPNLPGHEGYVADKDGVRALRAIEVSYEGDGPDGQPAAVVHEATDVFGNSYTIRSDIEGRLGHVPLLSEAVGHKPAYLVIENFVHSTILRSGERGIALVELGRNTQKKT